MAVLFVSDESEPVLTLCFEAVTAVHGTISAGLEGNLGFAAAAVADHGEHLPGSTAIAVLGPTGSAAGRAAGGLVLEALLGKEFLLTGRENEFVDILLKMLFTRAIGEDSCPVPDNGYE